MFEKPALTQVRLVGFACYMVLALCVSNLLLQHVFDYIGFALMEV
jgi:hypothetical protein